MHAQGIPSQGQLSLQGMNSLSQNPTMGNQQQPSIASNPQGQGGEGGQADYSAQWAQYYRSLGKVKEAEAIEAQMKLKVSCFIL